MTESHFDVLIIGAGVIGMASAYHILKNSPSKKILVIDNLGAPGQAGSGRSAAMFRNTFSSTDNQVLANSSIEFYLSVQKSQGVDLGLELVGYLWLMSERQLKTSAKSIEKMSRNRVELKSFSAEDLRNRIPGISTIFEPSNVDTKTMDLENIDGAIFGIKCGKLEPDRLVGFYYDRFLALGGQSQFNTRATKLIVEPCKKLDIEGEPFVWQDKVIAGVQVSGRLNGIIYANTLILAGGAWNNILLEPIGFDGHVKSKKRQIFQSSTSRSDKLRKLLFTKGFNEYGVIPFMVLPKCGIYVKPVRMGEQFWIGCDEEMNREYIDLPDFDPDRYVAEPDYYQREIYPVLSSYFPSFRNLAPSGMWAGLMAYNTMDYLPLVFQHENVIVVGGDSGSGIMKADSLGRIVESLYRLGPESEASLFGDVLYRVSKLGVKKRSVEPEEWVL